MKKGFTLIELLVVVLIIGILSAIALPQYQRAVLKSRAAEGLLQGKTLLEAMKLYYLANGEYTKNLEELDVQMPEGWVCPTSSYCQYTIGQGIRFEVNRYSIIGLYCVCNKNDKNARSICSSYGPLHHVGGSENPEEEYYRVVE